MLQLSSSGVWGGGKIGGRVVLKIGRGSSSGSNKSRPFSAKVLTSQRLRANLATSSWLIVSRRYPSSYPHTPPYTIYEALGNFVNNNNLEKWVKKLIANGQVISGTLRERWPLSNMQTRGALLNQGPDRPTPTTTTTSSLLEAPPHLNKTATRQP